MKKTLFSIVFLLSALLACGVPAATPTVAPIAPEVETQSPPYLGLWMSDTESYMFTETNLYYVVIRPENGQVNEEFSEIIAYDPLNNHITLRKIWIRVNGKPVGFEGAQYSLTYSVNGNTMQLGLGTETEFAVDLNPAIFTRK